MMNGGQPRGWGRYNNRLHYRGVFMAAGMDGHGQYCDETKGQKGGEYGEKSVHDVCLLL